MKKLYYLITTFFVALITAMSFSWAVWHITQGGQKIASPFREWILEFAQYPSKLKLAFGQVLDINVGAKQLRIDISDIDRTSWVDRFPEVSDDGYLLLSGVDPKENQSNVRLIQINNGKEIHRWSVDFKKISDKQIITKYFPYKSDVTFSGMYHPLLMPDGGLLITIDGTLVRLSKSSEILWINSGEFHHSIEVDGEGNIWTPTVVEGFFSENDYLHRSLRDDGISKLSPDGKILFKESFSKILIENNLRSLLLGQFGFAFNNDPIHMNDITPALFDGKYWKKGDLLISARHLSTIFLYRPSSGKILWHQTGPWMNQHDVKFLDEHRISIFGNDVVSAVPVKSAFLSNDATNNVYIYDFEKNQITKPFEASMRSNWVRTITEGRARIISEDRVFLEESNYGRHLMLSKNGLIWSRINFIDDRKIGLVCWSRYFKKDEIKDILQKF